MLGAFAHQLFLHSTCDAYPYQIDFRPSIPDEGMRDKRLGSITFITMYMADAVPSLEEYYSARAALISEDRSSRKDSSPVSELELKADNVVREIRVQEAQSVWSADYNEIPHPFPGMEFLTG